MILARIVAKAVSMTKHPSFEGARMLVAEPIGAANNDPVLVFDEMGSCSGDLVVLSSDGIFTREMLGDDQSPGRWWVMAIIDNFEEVESLIA